MGAQFYNLKRVACYLRDVRVEGFAPSDAIGIDRMKRVITEDNPPLLYADESAYVQRLFPHDQSLDDAVALGPEACLSVPGLVGQVPRLQRIRYRGQTLEGDVIEREAGGFHARVVQHECDHLDGILYPQRMTDLSMLAFAEEAMRAQTAEGTLPSEPAGGEFSGETPLGEDEVLQDHG